MNIQDKIAQLECEHKALGEKINELKEDVKKREINANWKPELNEEYYFFNGFMKIYSTVWFGTESDNMRYIAGGCFRTWEEAEFMLERLKVIQELKQFARPYNENYKAQNWVIVCEADSEEVWSEVEDRYIRNELFFESMEMADRAIKAVGEERIKRYYLQMEEE